MSEEKDLSKTVVIKEGVGVKYQIQWTSKFTSATGFGTGTFDPKEAQDIAESLNGPDRACTHVAVVINTNKS